MKGKSLYRFMFLIGLFADFRVHLVGMIGISEIVICLMAPFLYFQDLGILRRDGFNKIIAFLFLTCVSCCISCQLNNTPLFNLARGLATPVVLLCSVIFMHHFLRKDLTAMKWFMFGYILCGAFTFLLRGGASFEDLLMASEAGGTGSAAILRMYILLPLLLIPIYSFYTKIPYLLAAGACLGVGFYTIISSSSGRSTALIYLAGGFLILIGQKSVQKMQKIKKKFALFLCLAIVAVFAAKAGYSAAAKSGLLGEASQKKYLMQTRGGESMLKLLLGGRSEVAICIMAAMDKPIFGFGPWAVDWNGYGRKYKEKYGADEDLAAIQEHDRYLSRMGLSERLSFIPFHSHIFGQWVWYGIIAFFLWVYVLKLIFDYYRKYVDVMPQWFGLFALLAPQLLWNVFFSPLFARVETSAAICCLLFAKALYDRKMAFSPEAWVERQKYLP